MDHLIDVAERVLAFLGGCAVLGALFALLVRVAG